ISPWPWFGGGLSAGTEPADIDHRDVQEGGQQQCEPPAAYVLEPRERAGKRCASHSCRSTRLNVVRNGSPIWYCQVGLFALTKPIMLSGWSSAHTVRPTLETA